MYSVVRDYSSATRTHVSGSNWIRKDKGGSLILRLSRFLLNNKQELQRCIETWLSVYHGLVIRRVDSAWLPVWCLSSSNTGNISLQLVAQRCCFASCKALLPVLPPPQAICRATNFGVASCSNMLHEVELGSTFGNKS